MASLCCFSWTPPLLPGAKHLQRLPSSYLPTCSSATDLPFSCRWTPLRRLLSLLPGGLTLCFNSLPMAPGSYLLFSLPSISLNLPVMLSCPHPNIPAPHLHAWSAAQLCLLSPLCPHSGHHLCQWGQGLQEVPLNF